MNRRTTYYLLLIPLFICAVSACSQGEAIIYSDDATVVPSREELRRAMQYHGVQSAQRDDDGHWYFIRNGKRCPLFRCAQGSSPADARDGRER